MSSFIHSIFNGYDRDIPECIQPVLKILRFRFDQKAKAKITQIEVEIINEIQKYPDTEVSRLIELSKSGSTAIQILQEIGFPMNPNSKILESIIDFYHTKNGVTEIVVYGALYQALAWVAASKDPSSSVWSESSFSCFEFGLQLLEVFSIFLKVKDLKIDAITSVAQIIIDDYLTNNDLGINDRSLQVITSHIVSNHTFPKSFRDTYFLFLDLIFMSKDQQTIIYALTMTREFIDEDRPFVELDTKFFEMISSFVRTLDNYAVELLCTAAAKTEATYAAKPIFELLADAILSTIISTQLDEKSYSMPSNEKQKVVIDHFDYKFIKMPQMQMNENIPTELVEKKVVPIELCPRCLDKIISILTRWFEKLNSIYIEAFMNSLHVVISQFTNSPKYLDTLAVLLYFASVSGHRVVFNSISKSFLSEIVFNPEYSIFNEEQMNETIYDFRRLIFDVLIAHSQMLIVDILIFSAQLSPYLFSEVLLFMLHDVNNLRLEIFCSEKIFQSLSFISNQLTQMYKESQTNQIRLARIVIITFCFILIENHSAFFLACSSPSFINCYFRFIFESSLTELFLQKLQIGLMTCSIQSNDPVLLQLVPAICHVFNSCSEHNQEKQYIKLASDLSTCITESLTHNNSLISSFHPVFTALLNYNSKNPSSAILQECFVFLSLKAQTSFQNNFEYKLFFLFIKIIKEVEGDEPSLMTQLKFLNLLSGGNTTQEQSLFLIKEPSFLPLFFVAFSMSSKLLEIIKFFSQLCHYSASNCIACHDGDLDFLLLELLCHSHEKVFDFYGYPVRFDLEPDQAFCIILPLISQIIRIKTSTIICDRLMRLINPKFQCNHATIVADMLNTVIASECSQRNPIYELYHSSKALSIKGLTKKDVQNGFAVMFWILIDMPQVSQSQDPFVIFTLQIDKKNNITFTFSILNGKFVGSTTLKKQTVSTVLLDPVPSNEWVALTINIKKESDSQNLVQLFKFSEFVAMSIYPALKFRSKNIKLTFGNKNAEKTKLEPPAGKLGPFAFFAKPFQDDDFFSFPFHSDPTFQTFQNVRFSSNNLPSPFVQHIYSANRNQDSFVKVFSSYYDLNYLTYLLTTLKQGQTSVALSFLRIIFAVLASSVEKQNEFKAVPILAHQISRIFGHNIKYNLYLIFFNFLVSCSCDTLIVDLLNCFIFNFEMWFNCDSASLIRIIHHWSSAILQSHLPLISKKWNFSRFLSYFRIHFFYQSTPISADDNDVGIQASLLDDTNERCLLHSYALHATSDEIDRVKEAYFQFLVNFGKLSITNSDLEAIYSYLFQTKENIQIITCLDILDKLAEKIISIKYLPFDYIEPLQYFFNLKDYDIVCAAIRTLSSLSHKDVHFMLSTASIQILPNCGTTKFFYKVLPMYRTHVNTFSLICILALNLGDKEKHVAVEMLDKICSTPELLEKVLATSLWVIWPICLGLYSTDDDIKTVANFLSTVIFRQKKFMANFEHVLQIIDFMANDYKVTAAKLSTRFIYNICKEAIKRKSEELKKHFELFLLICFRMLYFQRSQHNHSSKLLEAWNNSPFCDQPEFIEKIPAVNNFLNLIDRSSRPILVSPLHFTVRMDDNDKWIDTSISDTLLTLFTESQFQNRGITGVRNILLYLKENDQNKKLEKMLTVGQEIHDATEFMVSLARRPILLDLASYCVKAPIIISEGILGIYEELNQISIDQIRFELDQFDVFSIKTKTQIEHLLKKYVYQRDDSLFIHKENMLFTKSRSYCYCFVPIKLKPVISLQQNQHKLQTNLVEKSTQTNIHQESKLSFIKGYKCQVIKPHSSEEAVLQIKENELVIVTTFKQINIKSYEVYTIMKRKRYQLDTAIEIYIRNGKNYFLDFDTIQNSEIINQIKFHRPFIEDFQYLTTKWCNKKLSSFKYLIFLNLIAGRSFNDFDQYPIFPWIYTDFENMTLRDLSKPIQSMSKSLINESDLDLKTEQLFRTSPLSRILLDYWLARLDGPNHRDSFNSFDSAFHHNISEGGDFCELPPDFYFMPETLLDMNSTGLGDIDLPSWSNTVFHLVYIMRKQLEHSENLHEWIDLMFGYKQRGEEAIKSGNIYHPFTYDNVWEDELSANLKGSDHIKAIMRLYGQMPAQLFDSPHPPRIENVEMKVDKEYQHVLSSNTLVFGSQISADTLLLIDAKGKIFTVTIDLENPEHFKKNETFCEFKYNQTCQFSPIRKGVMIFDPLNDTLQLVQEGQTNRPANQANGINAIGSIGPIIVTLKNRTIISLSNIFIYPEMQNQIVSICDTIICFTTNDLFNVLVYITRNGLLHINSIPALKKMAITEIHSYTANKILITTHWGFIVVGCEDKIIVYNINGNYIGQTSIPSEITYWTSTSTRDDFDYVFYVLADGQLGYFEAFNPNDKHVILQMTWTPCFIAYSPLYDVLHVITSQGKVSLIPCVL